MAIYIAKENKCATVDSTQPDVSGLAEVNKSGRFGAPGGHGKSYLDFDFSGLPQDVVVTNATLYLYRDATAGYGDDYLDLANNKWALFQIQWITSPWEADKVTWNTKPSATTHCGFKLAATGATAIDITPIVQGWVNGTIDMNGICANLNTDMVTKGMWFSFYSHYGDNQDLIPYIEINYIGQQVYKIAEPRIREIGDQVRRISGTTDYMTVEEMVTKLSEYQLGDGLLIAEEGVF